MHLGPLTFGALEAEFKPHALFGTSPQVMVTLSSQHAILTADQLRELGMQMILAADAAEHEARKHKRRSAA